jgi:hypothetical protein
MTVGGTGHNVPASSPSHQIRLMYCVGHIRVRLLLAATSFKFGFSASIGGANDFHEVWDLNIESVNPVTPVTPAAPVAVTPAFTG